MSDNNATNNAINENRPTVSGKEKKKFFAGVKEKAVAFEEKHPKGCSIARKIGKGLAIGGAAVGGFVLGSIVGSNKSSENDGIDLIETEVEVFDDAPVEDTVDNNDNN